MGGVMYILIIIIGLILIISNYRKVFNEETTFSKELNLKKKDELSIKLIELRSEMGESFFQEQQEIEELENQILKIKEDINYLHEALNDLHLNKNKKDKNSVNNKKVEEIRELLVQNMPIEEICHKTGSGKGEVLLIKELFPI